MSEKMPFLVPSYAALAPIYNQAGLAQYATDHLPYYVSYAQSMDWAGRRILDLGCGTGVTSWWLAQQGYYTVGIDNSPYMLQQARASIQERDEVSFEPPDFVEMDIRQLESPIGPVDMVVTAGCVLNAIQSLRELEATFTRIKQALDPGRLFIFDMRTIRGLADEIGECDRVLYDNNENLMVIGRNSFSYETLSSTQNFLVWRRQNGLWQRQDEQHIERGYPTQGVIAILERAGFRVMAVLNPDMSPFDVQHDYSGHVVFVAQKPE
ncbi:MAG TPA: class I SAM-dependent methyltransferase [Aggregatilineaceae bacterium]|nr:class I SAM-dependent methyltransferase [Aggregatilineaceae bacterium]